jgi:hypothetical protein
MATHKANINFYLYTGFNESASAGVQALNHLDASGIKYNHMHYFSKTQTDVLNWVKDNFADSEYAVESPQFPFVVYEQAFDIKDTPARKQVLVHGIDDILNTDWAALESFEG